MGQEQEVNLLSALIYRRRWIVFSVLLVLAVVTRFWDAHLKPFHHDESLHAYYSWQVYLGKPHRYDGLLHGPLLYYLVAFFYTIGSVSDFWAHMAPSLAGVALVCLPFLGWHIWGRKTAFFMSFLILFSPTFSYFSRFLREDIFVCVWIFGFVVSVFSYMNTRRFSWLALAASCLAFHFVNKENSYVHSIIWLSFVFCLRLFKVTSSDKKDHRINKIKWTHILGSSGVFIGIFVVFYSAFFRHPDGVLNGVLDGAFRKSIGYWWQQNKVRRIDGAFDYHWPIIFNYDFLISISVLLAFLFVFYRSKIDKVLHPYAYKIQLIALCSVFVTLFLMFLPPVSLPWAVFFHFTHSRHLFQILFMISFGFFGFYSSLFKRRILEAFLWFWLTGASGAYCYLGEKVPWLSLYILLPAAMLGGMSLAKWFAVVTRQSRQQKLMYALFSVLLVVFTAVKLVRVCWIRPADPAERLVFTQTTPQLRNWMLTRQPGPLSVSGDGMWPLAWYLRNDFPYFAFPGAESADHLPQGRRFRFIVANPPQRAALEALFPDAQFRVIPLRAWWVPHDHPSWSEIIIYFLFGRPYGTPQGPHTQDVSGMGSTDILIAEVPSYGDH